LKYAPRLAIERSYLSGELPKLDMMTVNKLLCLLKGYRIIRAFEWTRAFKLAICANNIRAILRHVAAPFDSAGAQNSLSPNDAGGGAVISLIW
jgi:hypothetical protein